MHNLASVSLLERWAFFLRHAEELTANQIRHLLPEPEFDEAVGVLEMIKRTPSQRTIYDARLKLQRDESARLRFAKLEGHQEGREEGRVEGRAVGLAEGELKGRIQGEQIGQIRLLQQLLGQPSLAADEFAKRSAFELASMITNLQDQLRTRSE